MYHDKRLLFIPGRPFDPVPFLNDAVANIICQIVFGRRFDYSDHNFQSMLTNLTEMAYLEGSIWALVRCKSSSDMPDNFTENPCTYNIVCIVIDDSKLSVDKKTSKWVSQGPHQGCRT